MASYIVVQRTRSYQPTKIAPPPPTNPPIVMTDGAGTTVMTDGTGTVVMTS